MWLFWGASNRQSFYKQCVEIVMFHHNDINFNILGVAGLTSIVLFKSSSRSAKVALTTFGLGFGIGESFRHTSTQFQNEKSGKH